MRLVGQRKGLSVARRVGGLLSSLPAPTSRPAPPHPHPLPSGVPGAGPAAADGGPPAVPPAPGGRPARGQEWEQRQGQRPLCPLRSGRKEPPLPGQLNPGSPRGRWAAGPPEGHGGRLGKGVGKEEFTDFCLPERGRKAFNSRQLQGQLRGLPTRRAAHRPGPPGPPPGPRPPAPATPVRSSGSQV